MFQRLSADLRAEFPGVGGFSTQNLWYMRQFYVEYRDNAKLQPLVGEISWTMHLVIMGRCKDALEREFYIRMTRKFGWTKNVWRGTMSLPRRSFQGSEDPRHHPSHRRANPRPHPPSYTPDIYHRKCELAYQHVYRLYPDGGFLYARATA